jgi:hypothetical protein
MPLWDLEQAWEQRWCPMVNGLLFPDGSVVPVVAWPAAGGAPTLGARVRISDLAGQGPLRWTTLGPIARAVSPDRARIAAVGDGGQDADGFVALLGGPQKGLVWLAFLDDSGPFEAVRFEGEEVVARAAGGREWRFPADAPERLVVTAPAVR